MQAETAAFGGSYKKAGDIAEAGGRTQRPVMKREVREPAMAMLEHFQPKCAIDISDMSGGKSFEKGLWLFGFLEGMRHWGLTPQCAAMVRVLLAGSMEFYMISIGDLKSAGLCVDAAGKAVDLEEAKLENIKQAFVGMTAEKVKAATEAGARVFYTRLEPYQTLYIPQSFLVLEAVVKGPLVFGLRKSYFEVGPKPHTLSNYEPASVILKASGSSTLEKHLGVLEFLKAAQAAETNAGAQA